MMCWFGPAGAETISAEADPRIGSRHHVAFSTPHGNRHHQSWSGCLDRLERYLLEQAVA